MLESRATLLGLGIAIALFAGLQAIPYGRDHTNPPTGAALAWDSPKTKALARRACFDCHSNETRWPWYSSIAPLSWKIQGHVRGGRKKLNFSTFDASHPEIAEAAGESGESITRGTMPPQDYLMMHPEARLSADEKRALVAGLDATFANLGVRVPRP